MHVKTPTVSLNVLHKDDSIKEIDDYLNKWDFYITPDGSISHSAANDPINLVLKHLTM